METVIEVYNKNVYGKTRTYPHNDLAKQLAALIGKKCFTAVHINFLEAIGFAVKNLTFSPDQD